MEVRTSRFGILQVSPEDMLIFEHGLIGCRELRRWCLLADAENSALGWLQSIESPQTALGVVSPRRFVPDYQLRASRQDLTCLELGNTRDAQIAVIVSRRPEGLSLNLRAPLVINVENRRGCQVVSSDPLPGATFVTGRSFRSTANCLVGGKVVASRRTTGIHRTRLKSQTAPRAR